MKETLNLAVINQSSTIMDYFLALEPSFERDVQKQPGSSRGEAQSAVSTNAHGHLHRLRREKSIRETGTDTVPFVLS